MSRIFRQPQEQFEITSLIGELMPKLPTDGIFSVDSLLERPSTATKDKPIWEWRDDRGVWHPYGTGYSRIIEAAHLAGDDEFSMNSQGKLLFNRHILIVINYYYYLQEEYTQSISIRCNK